jgi:hypothetical protein
MSENAIMFQVLGALVAVFFIFLTYMNAKSWRWVHVTFTFLVFAATFTFCVFAARTLKTRATWIKLHDDLEKRLATVEEDIERTTRGDPQDAEGRTPSVFSVREELGRTILDRGRVWRGCQPNIDRRTGLALVQTSPPPDPNNPAAAPARKNNIAVKTILHAFREAEFRDPKDPEKVSIVPVSYIGEFRATAVTDNSVTLEATMQLGPDQQAAGSAPGTWALYETAPVDGHEWFMAENDEDRVAALKAFAIAERMPENLYNQIAQPYLRDGKEASDTDPPENVWYEVTFEQEYEVAVDAPIVNSLDAEPFNTEGQAVLKRLRRSATPEEPGKVTFGPKEGQIQTAVLDQQTAQSLIDRGIAKLEKKIYRRKLTDYERMFRSLNERVVEINGRLRQLDLDNKAMLASAEKAKQQQALVEELKGKINDDLVKVKYELTELEKYKTALRDRLTAVQMELSQLYLSNKAIGRELAKLTADLTEQIDRRGREATARTRQ